MKCNMPPWYNVPLGKTRKNFLYHLEAVGWKQFTEFNIIYFKTIIFCKSFILEDKDFLHIFFFFFSSFVRFLSWYFPSASPHKGMRTWWFVFYFLITIINGTGRPELGVENCAGEWGNWRKTTQISHFSLMSILSGSCGFHFSFGFQVVLVSFPFLFFWTFEDDQGEEAKGSRRGM